MRPKGSAQVLVDRRRRALKLVDKGLSLNEVGRRLGCLASSVMRWRDQRKREGDGVYEVRSSPGRPPRLSARQKQQLARLLVKGAMAQGYRTDLWTTARVAEVIQRAFGVTYHRDHVGRLLHGLDFSCQKPDRRALERDEEEIERWKREEWPRIKKGPRTWAPRSIPKLIRGPLRQVPNGISHPAWLVDAVSEALRVAGAGDNRREEASSGARAVLPIVHWTADFVRRRGGSSR